MKNTPTALACTILPLALALCAPTCFAQSVSVPVSVWTEIEAKAAAAPATGYNMYKAAMVHRELMKKYYESASGWKAPEPLSAPAGKLSNLSDKPTKPRFVITPQVWPSQPGEASVCLWEDDKVAAVSFGIDDNNASDVPAWLEISKAYGGLNITWNLITYNIGGTVDPGRKSSAGTWELWQSLLAQGYDVQSHTMTHVGDPVFEDGWPGPDWEAAESQRMLDAGLPGHRTKLFVPPGSSIKEFNISMNWRASMVKYYAAARGFSGVPINPANQIDYFNIRTTSAPDGFVGIPDKSGTIPAWIEKNQLQSILDPSHTNYRGWATFFIHNIGSKDRLPPAFTKVFEFFNENRADLWVGHLTDIALYGQERDTATLTTTGVTPTSIRLALTSKMDPANFDYPLTVKVRLPDSWKTVKAAQGGNPIAAQLIQHEGAAYALIKAIPDQGEIVLTN
jgi:hypothetical protein